MNLDGLSSKERRRVKRTQDRTRSKKKKKNPKTKPLEPGLTGALKYYNTLPKTTQHYSKWAGVWILVITIIVLFSAIYGDTSSTKMLDYRG